MLIFKVHSPKLNLSIQFSKRNFSTSNWILPKNSFIEAIGRTPLIRLRKVSEETGCEIFGKAEWMNPGGSVKDRAAYYIIKDAENKGLLKSGGTVVEGTAGNTGIGMAHVCKAQGYNLVIYMPNTQSQEKVNLLRALGADVKPVPAVPFTDNQNYNHQARRHAENIPNAIWGNQFDNTANRLGHFLSTGPEIWEQTQGKLDAFTCATGTGGTFAGVTQFLKEKNPKIQCWLADPPGSVLYSYFKTGKLERTGDSSITEGIGQGRVTENMKGIHPDGALHIPDSDTIKMVFDLLHEEGLYVGASSALNVVAARELGKKLGPGHRIVTIVCDGAYRYQTRLFSKEWLISKKLLNSVPEKYHSSLSN